MIAIKYIYIYKFDPQPKLNLLCNLYSTQKYESLQKRSTSVFLVSNDIFRMKRNVYVQENQQPADKRTV